MKKWLMSALLLLSALQVHANEADDGVVLNMRDADIRTLIQWMSDQTGRNFIVHRDVSGQVSILSSTAVDDDELYRIFLSVLQVNGFAAVDTGAAIKILPSSLAMSSGVSAAKNDGATRAQTFALQHADAEELAKALKPLLSQQAVIAAFPQSNSLLVVDHGSSVDQLGRLVRQLDREQAGEYQLITLNHASALDIASSLRQLRGENAKQLSIAVDERSNSLILTGSRAERASLTQLIEQMDRPLSGQGNARVVYLNYADAEEIAPILQRIAESIQQSQKQNPTPLSIEASNSANALVINAPTGLMSTLQRIVRELDIQRAQVLVEAMVVEVSADFADEFGVNWFYADEGSDAATEVAAVNALGNLSSGTLNADGSFSAGRGITFGYFDDNFQAVVRALKTSTQANVLSTPTVVALDNEEASLLVGQNVPFITGQATSSASSTSEPFTTIERQDIGISLVVTPRINRGETITLDIHQKTESIAPSVSSASDLVTNKREVLTKAQVKNGQVLVLGGLISDEETEIREKVPVLGDIPLLGRLFSSRGTQRAKKNLMVFIHPVILADEAQSRRLSRERYDFMRQQHEAAREGDKETTKARQEMPAFEVFSPSAAPSPSP